MTCSNRLNRGFSLLELIAVLVVLGLLLAVAVPRMDGGRGIEELGFTEEVLADLRVAQRRAQADGCPVRVSVAAAAIRFDQRASLCSGPFNRAVAATGEAGATLGGQPPAGMLLSASPGVFYFDSSGAVLDSVNGAPVDVSITLGLRQVQINGTTGYASF